MPNPVILIADDDDANRVFVANMLTRVGWDVVEAVDGDDAIASAVRVVPDLVVMDIDMPRLDGWAATTVIRTAAPPLSSVPILAYTVTPFTTAEIVARGMDGRLPKPCAPDELLAAIERWRPSGIGASVDRLAAVFGRDQMASLIIRFRDQLTEALAALDGGAADVPAHRIAGVAGTLGFADVSASWLALTEPMSFAKAVQGRDHARREARIAMAHIDRDWNVV